MKTWLGVLVLTLFAPSLWAKDNYSCRFTTSYTGASSTSFNWDGSVPSVFGGQESPGTTFTFTDAKDPYEKDKVMLVMEVRTKGATFTIRETVYRGEKSIKSAFRSYRDSKSHQATLYCSNRYGTAKVYKTPPEDQRLLCDAQVGVDSEIGSVSFGIDAFSTSSQYIYVPVAGGRLEVRPRVSRQSAVGGYSYRFEHSLYFRKDGKYCYLGVSGGVDVSRGDFFSEYLAPQYSPYCPDFGLMRCRWATPPFPKPGLTKRYR